MTGVQRVTSAIPVHPHGRGDNDAGVTQNKFVVGSPPRAWGQSRARVRGDNPRRFTPTGVGTIRRGGSGEEGSAVHPHGRGDNLPQSVVTAATRGSPPRAWGQFGRGGAVGVAQRFTPTGVGTMSTGCPVRRWIAVHPHGRGDNRVPDDAAVRRFGSPPRAWGQ